MSLQPHGICPACGRQRPLTATRCEICGSSVAPASLAADATVDRPIGSGDAGGSLPRRRRATTGPKAAVGAPSSHAYSLASKELHHLETADGLPAGVADKIRHGSSRPVTIGSCEVLNEIARGGMGVVYKARQVGLNRVVALKVLIAGEAASETQVRRFLQEARSAARLKHPNIVPIYEVGEEDGRHFFTMEFVEGQSLGQLIAQKPLNAAQVVALMEPVAEAVHYAHTQGIIHRDLKPANILIDERGQPRVADFGLARDVSGASSLSQTGHLVGTPAYLSPEQAQGQELDPRSDVYALGVVMFEMLTGQVPFEAANLMALLGKIAYDDPPRLEALVPNIDGDLKTIVMTCLDKDPQRRYRSAEALAADLKRYRQGEPIAARPASLGYRLKRQIKKHRGVVVGSLIALVAGLAAVGVWWQVETQRAAAEAAKQTEEIKRLKAEADTVQAEKARKAAQDVAQVLQAQNQQLKQQSEKRWETVFQDDFDGDRLGPSWEILRGTFKVGQGAVRCGADNNRNNPEGVMLLDMPITGDVEVNLIGTAAKELSPELALCVFTTKSEVGYAGYFVSLKPSGMRVTRENVPMYGNEAIQLTPEKPMQIMFRREAERVTIQVNQSQPVLLTDWSPPSAANHCYLALYGWNSQYQVDAIRVAQAALPEKPELIDVAEYQRARGKLESALETIDLYLQQNQNGPAAERGLQLRAGCLESLGRSEDARKAWAVVAQRFPNDKNRFGATACGIRSGDDATAALEQMAASVPQSDAWSELVPSLFSRMYNDRGRFSLDAAGAQKVYQQALDCAGRVVSVEQRAQVRRLISLSAQNLVYQSPTGINLAEKIQFLKFAIDLQPNDFQALYILGQLHEMNKDLPSAIEAMEAAVKQGYSSEGGLFRLAQIYMLNGNLKGAEDTCRRTTELNGVNASVMELWGKCLMDERRHTEALDKYQRAIKVSPKYPQSHLNAAVCCLLLGRHEDALAYAQAGAKLTPNLARGQWLVGRVYLQMNEDGTALPYLRKSVELDRGDPQAQLDLALALLRQHFLEEGLAIMRQHTLDPKAQQPYMMAYLMSLITVKAYDEAGREAKRNLAANPELAMAHGFQAVAMFHAGDTAGALEEIAAARKLPATALDRGNVALCEAHIYALSGEYDKALAILKAAKDAVNDDAFRRGAQWQIDDVEAMKDAAANTPPPPPPPPPPQPEKP